MERLECLCNEEITEGSLMVATEPLAASSRWDLPSSIAAATSSAGVRSFPRGFIWGWIWEIVVIFGHRSESWRVEGKKKEKKKGREDTRSHDPGIMPVQI